MFKTDETVRFGQILSARTLRYGKFNEYYYVDWPREIVTMALLADPPVASLGAEPDSNPRRL